jgi:KaiC/GvpD/RAD55 family RecA-like ATPase
MERIPFGVSRLDEMVNGGAPRGSTVLLSGELGAGAREFLYTSAAMNGLAQADEEAHELYYGSTEPASVLPGDVHYLSFTAGKPDIVNEMSFVMDDDLVETAVEAVDFANFSPEYFQTSRVPTDWYSTQTSSIASLGERHDRRDILDAVGDYLSKHGDDSLVLIDSVTDLVSAASDRMGWNDITLLIKGLTKASRRWGGLVLLLANQETMSQTNLGRVMEACDGTFSFSWESGGSERSRTMFVQQFRGVLSQLEDEDIVRFETEIHDGGFDISNVRKIR